MVRVFRERAIITKVVVAESRKENCPALEVSEQIFTKSKVPLGMTVFCYYCLKKFQLDRVIRVIAK